MGSTQDDPRCGESSEGCSVNVIEFETPANDEHGPDSAPEPGPWDARLVRASRAWVTDPPPPRVFLLRDVRTGRGAMPATGSALLVAEGGAGKSFATIGLHLALGAGAPWLGTLAPEKPCRSLIVSAEESHAEIQARIYHVARGGGLDPSAAEAIDVIDVHDLHMPLLTSDAEPTLYAHALIDFARRHGPYGLVSLDPLARVAGASIDGDNVAACALVTVLEGIASAAGGLVLGVHHTSQTARRAKIVDATAVRGATGLGDSARMVVVLSVERVEHADETLRDKLGEIVTVTYAKANHVRRWEPIQLRRSSDGVLLPLDPHDAEMVASARTGADPFEIRRAQREQRTRERTSEIADAVRAALRGAPGGLTYRGLRAAVSVAIGGCADAKLDAAIEALGGEVTKHAGPRRAVVHCLSEVKP